MKKLIKLYQITTWKSTDKNTVNLEICKLCFSLYYFITIIHSYLPSYLSNVNYT